MESIKRFFKPKNIEERKEEKILKYFNLKILNDLIERYPQIIIGGSTALFLYGITLKRWEDGHSDYDVFLPYYIKLKESNELLDELKRNNKKDSQEITTQLVEMFKDETNLKSGNDYDYSIILYSRKIDIKIDPKQAYNEIQYNDITYKVVPLEQIIEAKLRYAREGNEKHKNDMNEILLRK